MATVIIGLGVLGIVLLAIRSIVKSNKKGNSCGCNCEGCSKSNSCH